VRGRYCRVAILAARGTRAGGSYRRDREGIIHPKISIHRGCAGGRGAGVHRLRTGSCGGRGGGAGGPISKSGFGAADAPAGGAAGSTINHIRIRIAGRRLPATSAPRGSMHAIAAVAFRPARGAYSTAPLSRARGAADNGHAASWPRRCGHVACCQVAASRGPRGVGRGIR
jgi:hypothetical protein